MIISLVLYVLLDYGDLFIAFISLYSFVLTIPFVIVSFFLWQRALKVLTLFILLNFRYNNLYYDVPLISISLFRFLIIYLFSLSFPFLFPVINFQHDFGYWFSIKNLLIILQIKGRVLGYAHTDYADTMYHLGTVVS